MSPFELFALNPCVFINRTELDKAYQRIQLIIHPDQHTDDLSKQAAHALSAKAANAYAKLKDPMGCIDVMLYDLGGVTLDQLTIKDSKTMAYVFDLQEQMMNFDKDIILKQLQEKLNEIAIKIETAFSHKDLESLKLESVKFAYLYKFWVKHK